MVDVSRKAFRIVELDGRNCGWVAEQDFHWNFRVSCTCFFTFPIFLFDWIVLILVRLEKSLSPLHMLLHVLVINTDDVTQAIQGTWICIG